MRLLKTLLPRMTAARYQALIAASPGHSHGGGESQVRGDPVPVEAATRSSFEPVDDPVPPDSAPSADEHKDDGHAH